MNSTRSWSAADTALFAMRMTVTSMFAVTRGSTGDGEHHALHHAKAQAQGQRGKECGGTTAGTKVPRVQLHDWSGHQAQDRAEISGAVQAKNPGYHAKGQRRQHEDDNGRAGPLYAGLAQLFRLLRNAGGARCSHALGPVATAGRPVASVENTTSPSCGTDRIASLWAVVQYGRQRPWPMVHRPEQSPLTGAFQCILQIARSPLLVRSLLAQLLEPPRYGPVCQVVWEGRSREAPPYPDLWHTASIRCGAKVRTRSERSGHAESVGSGSI